MAELGAYLAIGAVTGFFAGLLGIGGGTITWSGGEDTDQSAVAGGYISVTPLHMDLTNYSLLETVRGWSLEG